MISDDNLDFLKDLEGLDEQEKLVVLEALKQFAEQGSSDILNELKYGDFAEIPVDINTFLDSEEYLGNGL